MADETRVNGSGSGVKRPTLTRLPPTEPPAADALRAIASAGAHFVLCGHDKRPISKQWEQSPPDLDEVIAWAGRGGLVGMIPASIGAVVVDLDPSPVAAALATGKGAIVEGTDERAAHFNAAAVASLAKDMAQPLGAPVLQNATRRPGGRHFWYRAPEGEVRNRKWLHGDVRGSTGFVVLWDVGAVAAAVIGNDFTMAAPVDLELLPAAPRKAGTDVEQMRAAKNGERNDLLNRLAYKRAMSGANMAPLIAAAIAAGLPAAEVSTTIESAEAGANRQDRKPAAKPTKWETVEGAIATAPELRGRFMFADLRGWYLRDEGGLWRPATRSAMRRTYHDHPMREKFRKGIRSDAVVTEWTAQLEVDSDLLDGDPMTAGLPDGRVLDLRDGTTRAPRADELITMALGVCPDDSGPPATWLRFLASAFQFADDLDSVVRYFRWWIRSALSGDVSAERMIFLHGQSGTGKNTLADLVLHLAGSYGAAVAAEHVVTQRMEHRQWLAQLAGKRFALVSDLPTGGTWTAQLHDLVSGGTIEANLMRRDSIAFKSRCHVLATGNTSPEGQAGIWRRLVQFECRYKPPDEQIDTGLSDKLRAEAGRILHWALTGAAVEPAMPAELALAAEAVRDEQNPVAAWLRESWRHDPLRRTENSAMWQAYLLRFGAVPERDRLTDTAFGLLLTAEFGPAVRKDMDGRRQVRLRKCTER